MKAAEDFREALLIKNINFWNVHDCSLCGYKCGYLFFEDKTHEVLYDQGCDCTKIYHKTLKNWQDVADFYSMQTNDNVIKK